MYRAKAEKLSIRSYIHSNSNSSKYLEALLRGSFIVHEAHIRDEQTGEVHVMQMDTDEFAGSVLGKLLGSELSH